jgi:hypothetical protein
MKELSNTKPWFPILLGWLIILFGFLGLGLSVVALLDPVGTKMADDSDPFGTPPSLIESLFSTLISVGIFSLGIWLVVKSSKKTKP